MHSLLYRLTGKKTEPAFITVIKTIYYIFLKNTSFMKKNTNLFSVIKTVLV